MAHRASMTNAGGSAAGPAEFTVRPEENGMRLLDVLARRRQTSRKKAKRLLDERSVHVNGQPVWMARHTLRKGQTVTLVPSASDRTARGGIPVLYEDADYLVVDKPAGRLSNESDSVESDLRRQRNDPALVVAHRLDKDTTGCLLVARSTKAFDAAVELFRRKQVSKTYHAIVVGRLPRAEGRVRKPLEGKPAVTHCKTLDTRNDASHLLVRIDTGRTHQIRRHLADLGCPVVGDRYYKAKGPKRGRHRGFQIGRQMLHASNLAFKQPLSGGTVRAKAPLPGDFRHCLKTFGLT